MLLSEKIRLLRSLEGNLRGLRRPLTKSEVSRLLQEEHGETLSQAYLSQLESGKREHMTARTRALLAAFFKVHPGYLVSDPEGFRTDLASAPLLEGRLDGWLEAAAQDLEASDPEIARALRDLAGHTSTRKTILLLARLANHPELLPRLLAAVQEDPPSPLPPEGTPSIPDPDSGPSKRRLRGKSVEKS